MSTQNKKIGVLLLLIICTVLALVALSPSGIAADTVLPADVLDAIDAIVAPGVDLAAHEKFDTPPALLEPALRRR